MLFRILLLLALVFLGIWLLRKMMGSRDPKPGTENKARSGRSSQSGRSGQSGRSQDEDSSDADHENGVLIRCAHCGVHLPQSDAFWREGQAFCSSTHRNLGPKKR